MNIGIIGFGHLGKALASGLIKSGVDEKKIIVNSKTKETLDCAKSQFVDIKITDNKRDLVGAADIIVLVVKPNSITDVLEEIKKYDLKSKTIISFVAGISIKSIRNMLDDTSKTLSIVRMMPNIAIDGCNGIIGLAYESINEEVKRGINIFERIGTIVPMNEKELDIITIVSASGLAYVAYLMNVYKNASEKFILNEKIGEKITVQLFKNVINIIENDSKDFLEIVEQISTKGGTTEAGIKVLENSNILNIIIDCFSESLNRLENLKEANYEKSSLK